MKSTELDRALANLDAEIAVLERCRARLEAERTTPVAAEKKARKSRTKRGLPAAEDGKL